MAEKFKPITGVEESFNNLGLNIGDITLGSDGYRAVKDVFRLENDKQFKISMMIVGSMASLDSGFIHSGPGFDVDGFAKIEKEKESLKAKNADNTEYTNIFEKLDNWLNKDVLVDGYPAAIKLDFLEKKFAIKDEEESNIEPKSGGKRFNLKKFLGDKLGINKTKKEEKIEEAIEVEPKKATETEPKESPTARYELSQRPYIPAHPDDYGYPERSGSTQPSMETGHTMWRTNIEHRKRFKAISLLSGQSQQNKNEDI